MTVRSTAIGGSRGIVLVTGGAGYIGSHACKALALAGYIPVAYDNLACGHEWAVKWGPLERGDILDRARLDEVLAKYRPVAIMHIAACAYVGESVTDPGKYYRNNVAGSLTLLEAARDHAIDASYCRARARPMASPIGYPYSNRRPNGRSTHTGHPSSWLNACLQTSALRTAFDR